MKKNNSLLEGNESLVNLSNLQSDKKSSHHFDHQTPNNNITASVGGGLPG
jgi:hypothetical protein